MALETVRVPSSLEPLFEKAEAVVGDFFRRRKDDPRTGTIEIFGARYVLVRGAALSAEFFQLLRNLFGPGAGEDADAFAASLLYHLAHAVGKSDATGFHRGAAESAAGDVVFSRILTKPYTGAELGQAIREALEQPFPPPADTPPS